MENIKLTSLSKTSGCAAKFGPDALSQALSHLPDFNDPNLLVGAETSDDAAVYKLTDDLALVQTLDFFTPIDDDPYYYGLIAATNALSDIYAMGGKPILALNIVAFPNKLDIEIMGEILRGGAEKVKEAGAVLAGGHTIMDDEPKYGLSVSGIINPNKVLKNFGAQDGDVLVLTKPLGTGLITTAIKGDMATQSDIDMARKSMTTLNKYAAEVINRHEAHALTDVTGFGLGCHSYEIASASGKEIHIHTGDLNIIGNALDYAREGLVPAGTYRNRSHIVKHLSVKPGIKDEYIDLVFDPQTSGGLLTAVPEKEVKSLLEDLDKAGLEGMTSIVGHVVNGDPTIVVE